MAVQSVQNESFLGRGRWAGQHRDQERAEAVASEASARLKQVSLSRAAPHSALGVDLVKGLQEGGEPPGPPSGHQRCSLRHLFIPTESLSVQVLN